MSSWRQAVTSPFSRRRRGGRWRLKTDMLLMGWRRSHQRRQDRVARRQGSGWGRGEEGEGFGDGRGWDMLVGIPVGWSIGQRAINGHIPLGQGIHMIICGPLATEVDLKVIRIKWMGGVVVDTPRDSKKCWS